MVDIVKSHLSTKINNMMIVSYYHLFMARRLFLFVGQKGTYLTTFE